MIDAVTTNEQSTQSRYVLSIVNVNDKNIVRDYRLLQVLYCMPNNDLISVLRIFFNEKL